MNPTVRNICGIKTNNNNNNNYSVTPKRKGKASNNNFGYMGESSIFAMKDLVPKEVKQRTGFSNISSMLSFFVVVCSGDMDLIKKMCSKLTWLEEWVLYLEYVYGHSINRWVEYEKEYNLHNKDHCRRVFRSKLVLVIAARKQWPMYATHEEE